MVAIVSGMVLEATSKINFNEQHQEVTNYSVLLFQTGQKANIDIKKVPLEIFKEIKNGQQFTCKVQISLWEMKGRSGISVSFLELPVPTK